MGGAQKQAVLDANMLATSHKVYLGMFKDDEAGEALKKQVSPQVEVVLFRKTNYLSTASRLAKFVRAQKIQLVHCHLYAPMIIASLASLWVKVPVLWHFHGHHFEVRKLPLNVLSKLPSVSKIIFVSEMLARYFEKNYRFPKEKTAVVYNSTQSKRLPELRSDDNIIRIGWVGRLVKLKRVQFLLNMGDYFKERGFSSFEILIAGDGPERKDLEKMTKEKGLEEKVTFLGFRTDLEKLYNQFDFFVLPSEEEALSLALIDAGNCGLPCLAFDVGGNKEIVKNGETGFIVYSEEELQQKAYQLSQNAALRKQMGANAEEYAKVFSEENHLRNLLKIYQQHSDQESLALSSNPV